VISAPGVDHYSEAPLRAWVLEQGNVLRPGGANEQQKLRSRLVRHFESFKRFDIDQDGHMCAFELTQAFAQLGLSAHSVNEFVASLDPVKKESSSLRRKLQSMLSLDGEPIDGGGSFTKAAPKAAIEDGTSLDLDEFCMVVEGSLQMAGVSAKRHWRSAFVTTSFAALSHSDLLAAGGACNDQIEAAEDGTKLATEETDLVGSDNLMIGAVFFAVFIYAVLAWLFAEPPVKLAAVLPCAWSWKALRCSTGCKLHLPGMCKPM